LAEVRAQACPAPVVAHLYTIALKRGLKGTMYYGRQTYDFHDGMLTFFAPGQVVQTEADLGISEMTGRTLG
jgi:AraC family transcriptional activator of pobA